jgi:glutaredoxin 3
MPKIVMYATRSCPYCRMADMLFQKKGVIVERIQVDDAPDRRLEMTRLSGRSTVPQIFINGRHVGGYTDLASLDRAGTLDAMLRSDQAVGE